MSKRLIPFLLLLSSSYSFSQNVNDSVLNLFFDVNKYQLNKQQLVQLDELVSKNVSFTCIKGFADSTGSIAYNKELSRKRANAVYIYLKKSLHDSEIKPGHYGEQQATGEDISYNRRVEICYKKEVLQESLLQEKTPIEEKPIVNEQKIIDSPTTKYELSNIYFVPDKAIIEACSFYAVDDAANYLKNFPGCQFEIVGHVNYVMLPAAMNNPKALEPAQKLSEERAKTVYDLLIERGIRAVNMSHKGVGNSQMVFKNPKNDEEKRKNMRVEILIYCKK